MKELEPHKRYTLAAALIATQSARTLDDLASMFIRRMQKIHVKAKEALDKYRVLDEILNNETELSILEHTTDTAGYTHW